MAYEHARQSYPQDMLSVAALAASLAEGAREMHCVRSGMMGEWTLSLTSRTAPSIPDCSAPFAPSEQLVLRLLPPDVAVVEVVRGAQVAVGTRGAWTMIYDEGCAPPPARSPHATRTDCRRARVEWTSPLAGSTSARPSTSCRLQRPCATQPLLVVGYGVTDEPSAEPPSGHALPSRGYWICQNGWGPRWGEDGYVRVAMGEGSIESAAVAVEPVS